MRERPFSIEEHLRKEPPPILYHYTSMKSALSIVENHSIWATDIFYLNDSSEYRHVLDALERRIIERFPEFTDPTQVRSMDFYRAIITREPFGPIYVSSFSNNRDDLAQWRGYCPPGLGVSIGFHTPVLNKIVSKMLGTLGSVIYIDESEGESFDELIDSIANERPGSPPRLSANLKAGLNTVSAAPFYKSNAFSSESEWRVSLGGAKDIRDGQQLDFRVGNSTLVPYKTIDFKDHIRNYITEVVVGPSPNMELSIKAVRQFLDSKQMNKVAVTGSTVPFRPW
jgi:hypothetical protein